MLDREHARVHATRHTLGSYTRLATFYIHKTAGHTHNLGYTLPRDTAHVHIAHVHIARGHTARGHCLCTYCSPLRMDLHVCGNKHHMRYFMADCHLRLELKMLQERKLKMAAVHVQHRDTD